MQQQFFFFFSDSGEMLYAYPHSLGGETRVMWDSRSCQHWQMTGLSTKTPEVAFRAVERQAGTRNSLLHSIGIPGCSSPHDLATSYLSPSLFPGEDGWYLPFLLLCGWIGLHRSPTFFGDLLWPLKIPTAARSRGRATAVAEAIDASWLQVGGKSPHASDTY